MASVMSFDHVESLLMVHVVEFQPVWSDSEEIDRLMNYWTE